MSRKNMLAAGVLGLLASAGFAGSYTWVGGEDGVWNAPENWDPSGVPGRAQADADIVTFPHSVKIGVDLEGATYSVSELKMAGSAATKTAPATSFDVTLKNGGLNVATCPNVSSFRYGELTLDKVSVVLPGTIYWVPVSDGRLTFLNGASVKPKYFRNLSCTGYEVVVRDGTSSLGKMTFTSKSYGDAKSIVVDNGVLVAGDLQMNWATSTTGKPFTIQLSKGGRIESALTFVADWIKTMTIELPAEPVEQAALAAKGAFTWTDAKGLGSALTIDATACSKGTYKVFSGSSLALPMMTEDIEVKLADGMKGSLTATATELTLTVTSDDVADNSWTTEPSISATSWWEGETAGTLDLGEAAYGTPVCDLTQEEINALPSGHYALTVTVPEAPTYQGLSKVIEITVLGEDKVPAVYTWKKEVTEGRWCDRENWTTDVGTLGFPSNRLVKAIIPDGVRTIDLEGHVIPLDTSTVLGLEINGAGQTIRNGTISTGRLWAYNSANVTWENVTIDLNSAALSNYYGIQKESLVTFSGTSAVRRGRLNANAYNDDLAICDGTMTVDGPFTFGGESSDPSYRSTKGTLTVRDATLDVGGDIFIGTLGNPDHVPPTLDLERGTVVCTNKTKKSGAYVYGCYGMRSPVTVKLALTEAARAKPRITSNSAKLMAMTVKVASTEKAGRYPLLSTEDGITFLDPLADCVVDVSALGKDWVGSLVLSADQKSIDLKIGQKGFVVSVR